ncbi:MAG: NADH-quinone oxidoreductase subunit K [Haloarculaceae archaeon]
MTALAYGVALALLLLGLASVVTGRNVVKTVIGVELMSKGVLVNFVATDPTGSQGIVVLLILVDAVVVAVLMGMVVATYRQYGTLDLDALGRLTW